MEQSEARRAVLRQRNRPIRGALSSTGCRLICMCDYCQTLERQIAWPTFAPHTAVMWVIENGTYFEVQPTWLRDEEGREQWVVAIKATFRVGEGAHMELICPGPPIVQAPTYFDEEETLLRYDTDFVLTKAGTDIIVHGSAHAPRSEPAPLVPIRLVVPPDKLDKTLSVYGDREWKSGWRTTKPESFTEMPVTYERAFGGRDPGSVDQERPQVDPRNPVGRGYARKSSSIVGTPVPNVQYPGQDFSKGESARVPAGFGPIPSHWLPRAGLAGTYDVAWERDRKPLLPRDFDSRFFRCAPFDQQLSGYLVPGDVIVVENMTASGLLVIDVPPTELICVSRIRGKKIEHEVNLYTVIVEPGRDESRVSFVWQSHLQCNDGHLLEATVVNTKL